MASERPKLEEQASDPISKTRSSHTESTEEKKLERTQTSATLRAVRDRQFEPIRAGDREQLTRLASTTFGRADSRISNQQVGNELERRDTLAGIELGDSVLDPTSSDFDVYKWARMYVSSCSNWCRLQRLIVSLG